MEVVDPVEYDVLLLHGAHVLEDIGIEPLVDLLFGALALVCAVLLTLDGNLFDEIPEISFSLGHPF